MIFAVLLACSVAHVHGATLAECESAKLKLLKAEQGARERARGSKPGSGKGPSRKRQSVEKLDEWLWKNCSNYAHELRQLEQGRM
jgi:hypothetical protein